MNAFNTYERNMEIPATNGSLLFTHIILADFTGAINQLLDQALDRLRSEATYRRVTASDPDRAKVVEEEWQVMLSTAALDALCLPTYRTDSKKGESNGR